MGVTILLLATVAAALATLPVFPHRLRRVGYVVHVLLMSFSVLLLIWVYFTQIHP